MRRYLLILAFIVGIASNLSAQEKPLDLRQLLERIKSENLQVLLGKEGVEQALQQSMVERSKLFPKISLSAAQSRAKSFQNIGNATFSGYNNRFDALARGELSVLDFRKIADYRLAKLGYNVEGLNYEALLEEILAQSAQAYFYYMRNIKRMQAIDANIARDKSLVTVSKALATAGVASEIDVTRAEVQLAKDRKVRLQQETILEQSELTIKQLLDIPATESIVINEIPEAENGSPEKYTGSLAEALNERSDFQAISKQLEQVQFEQKSSYWDHLPSINTDGTLGRASKVAFDDKDKGVWSVGVNVSLPVFEGFRVVSKTRQARAKVRAQKFALKDLQNTIAVEVALNQKDLNSRYQQLELTKMQVQLGKRELDLASVRFQEGVADNQEVVDAQANLAQVEDELVEARYQYNLARVEWARAHGDISKLLKNA